MAFLNINGIEFNVEDESFSEEIREIGETSPAFDGTMRKTRQAIKRDCTFSSKLLESDVGYAWDGLLRGLGETWNFDGNLYSSKGVGPTSATATVSAVNPQFGSGCLLFTGAQSIVFPVTSGSAYTVGFWRSTDGGVTYDHYLVTSNGHKWIDGVRNDGASTGFYVFTPFTLTFNDTNARIDNLMFYPFAFPVAWGPAHYNLGADHGSPWPPSPYLYVHGDAVPETSFPRVCMGNVTSTTLRRGVSGGSWRTNLRKLVVNLQEI